MHFDVPLTPILVTDDNPTDVFFLQRRLNTAGIREPVYHVGDGIDAIHWFERHALASSADPLRPWLMFLDLKMPGKTGFDVLSWMRERQLTEILTTVVVSTSDDPGDMRRVIALGAHKYLVKYPQPTDLAEMVSEAKHRLERFSIHPANVTPDGN